MFHVKHREMYFNHPQDNVSRETFLPKILLRIRETFFQTT